MTRLVNPKATTFGVLILGLAFSGAHAETNSLSPGLATVSGPSHRQGATSASGPTVASPGVVGLESAGSGTSPETATTPEAADSEAESSLATTRWFLMIACAAVVVFAGLSVFLWRRQDREDAPAPGGALIHERRRAAQSALDAWTAALTRRLAGAAEPGVGGDARDTDEAAVQADRDAVRLASEPGIRGVAGSAATGAPPELRECTKLVLRLAAAAKFDVPGQAAHLDAAFALLQEAADGVPKRGEQEAEAAGPEAAACVELARAAAALASASVTAARKDELYSIAEAMFQAALRWLPNAGDIQVHIEKSQLLQQRAVSCATAEDRAKLLGRALHEVREAQWKNRKPAGAGAVAVAQVAPVRPQIADRSLEGRLCELEFAIRLTALSVPSLADLIRVDRAIVTAPVMVRTVESLPSVYEVTTRPTVAGPCDLSLENTLSWVGRVQESLNSVFVAGPGTSPLTMNWSVMRLRLGIEVGGGTGGAHVSGAWQGLEGIWAGGQDAATLEAEGRLSREDVSAIRERRLLILTAKISETQPPPGEQPSVGRIYDAKSPYADAVVYFAALVELRAQGRPAPAAPKLRSAWHDHLDAGLTRPGLFKGERKSLVKQARNLGVSEYSQFWDAYLRGHLFVIGALEGPLPPDTTGPDPNGQVVPTVQTGPPGPPGPELQLQVIPIRETIREPDQAERSVIRGLRLLDFSTACRPGNATESIRKERERLKRLNGLIVRCETSDPRGGAQGFQRIGVFGLPLHDYAATVKVEDYRFSLDGGGEQECLQLAELRFDLVAPIPAARQFKVVLSNLRDRMSVVAELGGTPEQIDQLASRTPPPELLSQAISVDVPMNRGYEIVPAHAPLATQAWSPQQIADALPMFKKLIVQLAAETDLGGISHTVAQVVRTLEQQFERVKDQHQSLAEFGDREHLEALETEAESERHWTLRREHGKVLWEFTSSRLPGAQDAFKRLLALDGSQALQDAAKRHGIDLAAQAVPMPPVPLPASRRDLTPPPPATFPGNDIVSRVHQFLEYAGAHPQQTIASFPPSSYDREHLKGLVFQAMNQRPRRLEVEAAGAPLLREIDGLLGGPRA